jgi:protein gp37
MRDQCQAAAVPFLFKQRGQSRTADSADFGRCSIDTTSGHAMARIGKKAAGRPLDGRTWDQMPKGWQ